jgi:hypothetical protein
LAEIAAGVLGTVATWVASTGSRVAGREAQTPRLVGACERQARGFLGGALRCLACVASREKKKIKGRDLDSWDEAVQVGVTLGQFVSGYHDF